MATKRKAARTAGAVRVRRKGTVTRKPDGVSRVHAYHEDDPAHTVEVKREFLAAVTDNGAHVDSAYFPTKAEAEKWLRDIYKIGG